MVASSSDEQKLIKLFETAIKHFWKKDYEKALAGFEKIRDGAPIDLTFLDRVNTHIAACERKLQGDSFKPKSADEHFLTGVVKLNNGETDKSVKHLNHAVNNDRKNDIWLFSLACAYAQNGQDEEAFSILEKAIKINKDNRIYARNAPDFNNLRKSDKFKKLVGDGRPPA